MTNKCKVQSVETYYDITNNDNLTSYECLIDAEIQVLIDTVAHDGVLNLALQ